MDKKHATLAAISWIIISACTVLLTAGWYYFLKVLPVNIDFYRVILSIFMMMISVSLTANVILKLSKSHKDKPAQESSCIKKYDE